MANPKPSPTQTIFNALWNAFVDPNTCGHIVFNNQPTYRNGAGGPAGLGVLIPDEAYFPEMEGARIKTLVMEARNGDTLIDQTLAKLFEGVDAQMLQAVQQLHDAYNERFSGDFRQYMDRGLRRIAGPMNLSIPEKYVKPEPQVVSPSRPGDPNEMLRGESDVVVPPPVPKRIADKLPDAARAETPVEQDLEQALLADVDEDADVEEIPPADPTEAPKTLADVPVPAPKPKQKKHKR